MSQFVRFFKKVGPSLNSDVFYERRSTASKKNNTKNRATWYAEMLVKALQLFPSQNHNVVIYFQKKKQKKKWTMNASSRYHEHKSE